MIIGRMRIGVFAVLPLLAFVSCAGGSQQVTPPSQPASSQQQLPYSQTFSASQQETRASVTLSSNASLPASAVDMEPAGTRTLSLPPCGSIPPIRIRNPFSVPITIQVFNFSVWLPCTPGSSLFGASFYQISPLPDFVSPVKLGNAQIKYGILTFTPTSHTFTLPPMTVSNIVILPEKSPDEIAFPVAPGKTTDLTSNSPDITSGLTFTYTSSSGQNTYSAACFNAFTGGVLAPALNNVPLVGIPSFFCKIVPVNNGTIAFGQLVTFDIGVPKPDHSIFEPDGVSQGFYCTDASSCNVPAFTVPTTYQQFIAGNVLDLVLCAPVTTTLDCNGVSGVPQGGSRTTVPFGSDFDVLVADDPTYKPGTEASPVPWDGIFRKKVSGQCVLSSAGDANNGDAPPKYSDAQQNGTGPYAEFDITPTAPGTCTITVSEDPKYITDYSNPSSPVARSASLTVTISGGDY